LFFIATSQKSGTPFSVFDEFKYQGTHTCQEKRQSMKNKQNMGTFSSLSPILIHCHFICSFNFSNTIHNIVSLKVGGEAELKTFFH
jgi:hypothetical protein